MISRNVADLHPDSAKWYSLRWSQQELGSGVTISTVTWTVPTGLQADDTDASGLTVSVKLSVAGGVTGSSYDVVCQIVTSQPETLHETLRITISTDGH